jgi:hypothetical protein
MPRALPAVFALVALVADVSGAHRAALLVLLAAIPAAFAFAVQVYGDAAVAQAGLARTFLAGGGLALLVLSAALRSPALVGGVPRLAVTAIGCSLLLYAIAAVRITRTAAAASARVASAEAPERSDRLAA